MKRRKKKGLMILLIAVLALAGLCVWQRENLHALLLWRTLSREELSEQMGQQQSRTEEASQNAGVSVRTMTEEEKTALHDSTLSREELIERLAGLADIEASALDTAQHAGAAAEPEQEEQQLADPQAALREQLAKKIAEVYVMEAEYTDWLEQANQAAIDDFTALPEEEQTSSAKYSIGMQYLSEALKKEKECDRQMQEIEDEIRTLLTQLGEDTALADEIHTAYTEEKASLKAYYLSLH